jgi:transposase-like protein
MLGHGTKFGHKKEQAIAALLSHRNVEEAARAVGISANTLLRWTKEPEFDAAYREARHTAFSQSIARLQQASSAAVTTLLKIMTDPNASSSTRVRAAEVVLERTAKAIEIEDIDVRLAELERSACSAMTSRKRSVALAWPSTMALPSPATTPVQIPAAPRLPAGAPAEKGDDPDRFLG